MMAQRTASSSFCLSDRPITCCAFNKDATMVAFSSGSSRLIHIVDCSPDLRDSTKWVPAQTLDHHESTVSCIVWHSEKDQLLSCAHDRSALVWVRDEESASINKGTDVVAAVAVARTTIKTTATPLAPSKKWVPQLVMLDAAVSHGLTTAAWNASGVKLYVGSASGNLAVGRYDPDERWWVCRVMEEVHSSILTAAAAHPTDNTLLATGSLDSSVCLVSTLMKKVDGKSTGAREFGHVYARSRMAAWVHALSWSPSGLLLAVATHDSRVHVMQLAEDVEDAARAALLLVSTVSLTTLPAKSCDFISDTALVCGGYDAYPFLICSLRSGQWTYAGAWTADGYLSSSAGGDSRSGKEEEQEEAVLATVTGLVHHTSGINCVRCCLGQRRLFSDDGKGAIVFATAGADGRIGTWWTSK